MGSEVSTCSAPVRRSRPPRGRGHGIEALGRYYSDVHGLSVICLRYGRVKQEDRPTTPRDFAVWCSLRDAAQMIERCIDAPESLRFDVFFVISNNKWGYRDISHAREVLGYDPRDGAESHR